MDTIRNKSMIKLALDTVELLILRWQVDETMSNKPVDRQEYYRLTRARDLLPSATRRWCCNDVTDNRRDVCSYSGTAGTGHGPD